MCLVATVQASGPASSLSSWVVKTCADSSLCPAAGTQTFSFNTGQSNVLAQTTAAHLQTATKTFQQVRLPAAPPAGSNKCYSCDPETETCRTPITCNSLETNCFSSSAVASDSRQVPVYGCASPNTCLSSSALDALGLLSHYGRISGPLSCCRGDNCNAPPTLKPPPTSAGESRSASHPVHDLVKVRVRIRFYEGVKSYGLRGRSSVRVLKSCADSSVCPRVGSQTFSLNSGTSSVLTQASCCDRHNCNRDAPADASSEVTLSPDASSEVTLSPDASSEVTLSPDASSEVTLSPDASSEVTLSPDASSEVTLSPDASSEVTLSPDASSEVTLSPRRFL
ncbi:hypothetical protein WMY93_024308 [Mugilogobius chulae]|uniref:UPAR/Ly6 domain-containing protein n=1 Tax=Mugilogobius chulae TaxID=88201 RepID=A0AAW0N2N6_9GOBI